MDTRPASLAGLIAVRSTPAKLAGQLAVRSTLVWMHLLPVPRDVDTAAEPDPLDAPHIIEELYQARSTRRATDQAVVQADGHQRGVLGALFIEEVEGIPHVPIKIIGMCEAMALVTAVVVGFVGVGNNQMRLTGDLDPVGKFVVERIPIIEKTACFDEQAPRVRPGPPGHPAHWARAS